MPDYPQTIPRKSKTPYSGLFQRELRREFMSSGMLIFTVLLSIVVLSQLIKLMTEAVTGALPVDGILALLGFSALGYMPILLSLSLFLSILMTLTRCYQDSEMVTWFSAGVGLTRWMRPVLWYAAPVVGLIALLSLVLSPWALSQADEYRRRLDSRDDVAAAQPGMFRESKQADRVYFLEDVDVHNRRVGNIFVQSTQHDRTSAMMAREGFQETAPNGDRFLVLLNGARYEGVPGQGDFRMIEFDRYAVRVDASEPRARVVFPKSYPLGELFANPTLANKAEFEWRLGLPLSALVLSLLAIPLSFVNPRAGRSFNLIMAVLVYMIYNNMISVTNTWVIQSKVAPGVGMLGLHLGMMLVVVLMFAKRMSVFSWARWKR